jgi:MFS transporter, NNP family, nitrate/nitrite transporter
LDLKTAGMLSAAFSIPGSVFPAYGGMLSDRIGTRRVMYWCFGASMLITFILSYPATDLVMHAIHGDLRYSIGSGVVPFAALTFALGFFMSLGKAAIYRHIPVYYPDHVGPVGGAVGMIGGLGGFVLPIAFGALNDLTGLWTSCFMLLFLVAAANLLWMHAAILRMERASVVATDRRLEQRVEVRTAT